MLKDTGTCWVNLGDSYATNSQHGSGYGEISRTAGIGNSQKGVQSRCGKPENIKAKSLVGIPERFAIAMTDRGWIRRNTIIWKKPSCMPSSAADRFTVDFEYLYFFTKNPKYYFEQQFDKSIDNGKFKNEGKTYENRNKRCVWTINLQPYSGAHFAAYPEELVATPIKAGCPKGGTVLDPFMGSGTTLKVARDLGRKGIGIELNPEYIELAEKRIDLEQAVFGI